MQKLHDFQDILQKTAKEAFGTESQHKTNNDAVLHLKKKPRVNGPGAPDEDTLVPFKQLSLPSPKLNPEQHKTNTSRNSRITLCEMFSSLSEDCDSTLLERLFLLFSWVKC